jgi:hypothetical protein
MNVSDTDRVSAIARVSSAKKKRSKTAAELKEDDPQLSLLEDEDLEDALVEEAIEEEATE